MSEIQFQQRYTIENIVDARRRALELMQKAGDTLLIDVSPCEEVDTAGIQLFVALVKEAEERGIFLSVKGPIQPKVAAAFAASGVHYADFSEAIVDG